MGDKLSVSNINYPEKNSYKIPFLNPSRFRIGSQPIRKREAISETRAKKFGIFLSENSSSRTICETDLSLPKFLKLS